MSTISDILEKYGNAAKPDDLRDLALLQLANSSVQDDAVGKAVQNLQGVEKSNMNALESYLMAMEEQARGEADKALQMAQQRLGSLDMNITTTLANPMGLNKEGKAQLAQMRAERDAILKAFPQLGSSESAGNSAEGEEPVDIVGSKDADLWKKFSREASLEQIAQLYSDNMGQIPEALESMLTFRMKNSPELTQKLKTDPNLRSISHLAGETLGDARKARDDAAKAAAKAKKDQEERETLERYKLEKDKYLKSGSKSFKRKMESDAEFKKIIKTLKKKNLLSGEELNLFSNILKED
ncbi:MAG: hypothetical protein MJY87_02385 [Fibrobacter sp.]|nr:hypothetical protein [Fibrobacter sp.]